jgi:hypothetical protein
MTVDGDKYVLDSGKSGHARLQVISEIHDDPTRALLLDAGLKAGDRFVEFGCGLGYVTRWASSVGADALGIDLSGIRSRRRGIWPTARPSSLSEACTTTACLRRTSTSGTRAGCLFT